MISTTMSATVYKRPWITDYQLRSIFSEDRFVIVNASTKIGKTVGCLVWLTEQAAKARSGDNVWWV